SGGFLGDRVSRFHIGKGLSFFFAGTLIWGVWGVGTASAQRTEAAPDAVEGVTVVEHLDEFVPLDLEFTDDLGKTVKFGDYFQGDKPVLLTLNYYGCPMLCGLQLNGILDAFKRMDWVPGNQFEVVTLSFDPGETYKLARLKKQSYITEYGKSEAAKGWHFLTGREDNIQKLTDAVGFSYRWDEESHQYVHAAVAVILTPKGKVSRYLYGLIQDPQTMRLSLAEASEGKVGSTLDQFLLFCFHYNATEGKYALAAVKLMKVGGILTLLILGAVLFSFWRYERNRSQADAQEILT
ncbi:MAG: SCO family protein, partial [Candidatus Omnitrophica bacterium]|nr:SCO family protein [Candidatus Omnitrophota bacterium]